MELLTHNHPLMFKIYYNELKLKCKCNVEMYEM